MSLLSYFKSVNGDSLCGEALRIETGEVSETQVRSDAQPWLSCHFNFEKIMPTPKFQNIILMVKESSLQISGGTEREQAACDIKPKSI